MELNILFIHHQLMLSFQLYQYIIIPSIIICLWCRDATVTPMLHHAYHIPSIIIICMWHAPWFCNVTMWHHCDSTYMHLHYILSIQICLWCIRDVINATVTPIFDVNMVWLWNHSEHYDMPVIWSWSYTVTVMSQRHDHYCDCTHVKHNYT